jgi:hypothetical protein
MKETTGKTWFRWEVNIKIVLREIVLGGVDWIHLAKDSDQWWAFINTVQNLSVNKMVGVSCVNEQLLASQK